MKAIKPPIIGVGFLWSFLSFGISKSPSCFVIKFLFFNIISIEVTKTKTSVKKMFIMQNEEIKLVWTITENNLDKIIIIYIPILKK